MGVELPFWATVVFCDFGGMAAAGLAMRLLGGKESWMKDRDHFAGPWTDYV